MKIQTREEYEREYNILRDVFKDSNAMLNKNLLILDNSFIKSLEEQNQWLQSLLDLKQQEISVLESKVEELEEYTKPILAH